MLFLKLEIVDNDLIQYSNSCMKQNGTAVQFWI